MNRRLRAVSGLAMALIVMLLSGCDNVDWGGADVAVVPPPPTAGGDEEDVIPTEERIPEGPIVFYVAPSDGSATLIPVGEVAQGTLLPIRAQANWESYGRGLIAQHMRTGTEYALFRSGARVGTLVLDDAQIPPEGVCPRVPRGRGTLELMVGADTIPEFLAMAKSQAPTNVGRVVAVSPDPDRRMQILGPILAERLLRARRAPLPGSWTRAMAQLKPFPAAGEENAAFASTFLVGDSLGIGQDDEGYSLFFIAEPMPEVGYDTVYAKFTPYETQGKQAPRVVDYLDWDRDEQVELLLEVYGTDQAWFEALGRGEAGWRELVSTRCE